MKPESGSVWLRFVCCELLVLALSAMLVCAQVPPPPDDPGSPAIANGPPATLHGAVLNAATGQPLPRALVKIESESLGALSDGDGRFSIPGVPSGLQSIEVIKPGFHLPGDSSDEREGSSHVVRVTADTPGLSFSLAPDNAISGHLSLSSGVPAEGIGLVLLRQFTSNGRPAWGDPDERQSSPSGEFRFYGLTDGAYLLMTKSEFDNTHAAEPACNADSPAEMDGYAPTFYSGSESLASASRIVVSGGQNAQVNLSLTMTRLYLVQVSGQHAPAGEGWFFEHALFDRSGQDAQYPIREEKNHTICAYLPDGAYTLTETVSPSREAPQHVFAGQRPVGVNSTDRTGVLEFNVQGHAERNLQLSLAQGTSTPINLRYQPGPPKLPEPPSPQSEEERQERSALEAPAYEPFAEFGGARTNSVAGLPSSELGAERINEMTYAFDPSPPGAYWIHATPGMPGTCMGEVTSAGQDLAQSPWVVNTTGTGAPIDAVLRTDCASLTLQMPATLPEESSGEGTAVYVYLVPEFSSVADILTSQLDQYGDRTEKLEHITPGTYRIFAFRTPHALEFRNPAALARMGTGQEITLQPASSTTLVMQEISQ